MTAARPLRFHHLDEIDSTSLHARREIGAGRLLWHDGPVAFIAAHQTGGIGRFGRAWASPRGGLWMTLAWPVTGDLQQLLDGLGLRIGVACVESVRSLAPESLRPRIKLKWPNDVVIAPPVRKVCGALCELVQGPDRQHWLLIGVGLNANMRIDDLPPELRDTAMTLQALTGSPIELHPAAQDLTTRLLGTLAAPALTTHTLASARAMLAGVGEPTLVSLPTGEKIEAHLLGINDSGHAVIRHGDSELTLAAAVLDAPAFSG